VRARAFGLDVDADFELPGFAPADRAAPAASSRSVRVRLVPPAELPADGHVLRAEGFASAWIADDGGEIRCAPADVPAWRWQRYLTGQLLPFAAVLQGLEVFHASAVVVEGRAVAVVARSGAGKTSVALELVLRGRPFLNDDVLVLEPRLDAGVVAHPGAGVANVRADAGRLPERLAEAGRGRALGGVAGETRMALAVHERPVELGSMLFLERTGPGEDLAIERLAPVDPRLLLAATFNLAVREPDRLRRQLDVCARIAESCAVYKVDCPPAVGAAALAEAILAALAGVRSAP
jgi:hypothetical protein